jgi:large subunit ribosomal protein L25
MQTVEITVESRDARGKGPARRLRSKGRFPGVVYGPKRVPALVSLSMVECSRKLARLEGTHLIKLLCSGNEDLHERMVLVREMQEHPVTAELLHTDFHEVDLTVRLTASVPLHFVGRCEGVVAGGILQPVLREVDVECLPTHIPEFIEVDVTKLAIHDSLHVRDLTPPADGTFVTDQSQTVVTVVAPTADVAPETEDGAVPTTEGEAAPATPDGAAENESKD